MKPEALRSHLDDAELNEYLDGALAVGRRATAARHLAECSACQARLAELQALFENLDGLADLPLSRDLTPAVLRAVQRRREVPVRAAVDLRQPIFYLIFAAQVLLAAALVVFVWPWLAARLGHLILPLALRSLASDFVSALGEVPKLGVSLSSLWPLQDALRSAAAALPLDPREVEAVLAGTALVWLLGHAWLLRGPLAAFIRRRS